MESNLSICIHYASIAKKALERLKEGSSFPNTDAAFLKFAVEELEQLGISGASFFKFKDEASKFYRGEIRVW
ncbi:hypothetical protein HQ403_00080 [Candidatus Kaiserbacteria bacterium]|nr:hypothetical protein [Candidatus Kaiserbacteria bacterium]